jgi:hypothetical protein
MCMSDTETTNPLDWFVNSLLQSTGQLMLIVEHMASYPDTSPDARPFDDVLRDVVRDALQDALKDRKPADLVGAAALLADVRELIGNELFLVDPRGFDDESCAGRPNRRERRRRM